MAYLPENHHCHQCGEYLGPDDGDADCGGHNEDLDSLLAPVLANVVRDFAYALGTVKVLLMQEDREGAMEVLNRYKLIFPDGAPAVEIPIELLPKDTQS